MVKACGSPSPDVHCSQVSVALPLQRSSSCIARTWAARPAGVPIAGAVHQAAAAVPTAGAVPPAGAPELPDPVQGVPDPAQEDPGVLQDQDDKLSISTGSF